MVIYYLNDKNKIKTKGMINMKINLKNKNTLRKTVLMIIVGIIVFVFFVALSGCDGSEELSEKVIRIHIGLGFINHMSGLQMFIAIYMDKVKQR